MLALFLAALPVLLTGSETAAFVKLPTPGVRYEVNVASATRAPWVDSNAWRLRRQPGETYLYDLSEEATPQTVALAMAEAHANNVKSVFKLHESGRIRFQQMYDWLRALPAAPDTPLANIAVQDDGSEAAGEALNLLTRKNLLFRLTTKREAADLNLTVDRSITDPFQFAYRVREKLTDARRLIRLYGSDTVLANLTGSGTRVRLSLVNYAPSPVEGLRVRLLGVAKPAAVFIHGNDGATLADLVAEPDATEFSLERLPVYAVVDLEWKPAHTPAKLR